MIEFPFLQVLGQLELLGVAGHHGLGGNIGGVEAMVDFWLLEVQGHVFIIPDEGGDGVEGRRSAFSWSHDCT